jgi:hypothetical protein
MTTGDLVLDTLWQVIQPPLPVPASRDGGRARRDDRACLAGTVPQPRPGIPGGRCPPTSSAVAARSPAGGGCGTASAPARGSGGTTSRWTSREGQLGRQGRLGWSPASPDPVGVRAEQGLADRPKADRPRQAREQPPAGRPRRHPAGGVPAGGQPPRPAAAGAARRRGGAGRGPPGSAHRQRVPPRPAKLHLDKGCDDPRCRRALRARGATPRVARCASVQPAPGPPPLRGARSLAWLVAAGGCRAL